MNAAKAMILRLRCPIRCLHDQSRTVSDRFPLCILSRRHRRLSVSIFLMPTSIRLEVRSMASSGNRSEVRKSRKRRRRSESERLCMTFGVPRHRLLNHPCHPCLLRQIHCPAWKSFQPKRRMQPLPVGFRINHLAQIANAGNKRISRGRKWALETTKARLPLLQPSASS